MSIAHIEPQRLIIFHEGKVTRSTALGYVEEMVRAKTPFITIERRKDNRFNVIGGFKYINGLRLLNKDLKLLCTIIDPFPTNKERKLAILQRCLTHNERIEYKEILVHELIHVYKMNERTLSLELGHDAAKIKK